MNFTILDAVVRDIYKYHCQVDPYNTQSAIALLRQHMEYEHQYDLAKLSLKNIANTQVSA